MWQKIAQNFFIFVYLFCPINSTIDFTKTLHNSGMVGHSKLPDPSLNRIFNALLIGIISMKSKVPTQSMNMGTWIVGPSSILCVQLSCKERTCLVSGTFFNTFLVNLSPYFLNQTRWLMDLIYWIRPKVV